VAQALNEIFGMLLVETGTETETSKQKME